MPDSSSAELVGPARVLFRKAGRTQALEKVLIDTGFAAVEIGDGPLDSAVRRSGADVVLLHLSDEGSKIADEVAQLRAGASLRHVPIIVLAEKIDEDSEKLVHDLALTELLAEPVDPAELARRIKASVGVKRLFGEEERKWARLASMVEISRAMNSTLDSGAILYFIARKISETMELTRCSFIVPDLASGIGRVIACKDDPNIQSLEINLANYPEIIKVLRDGNRVIIEDIGTDPIMAGVRKFADVFRDQSIMTLPLKFQDEVSGVLQIRKKSRKKGFVDREVEYCELLANAAASALKNAQLYEDIERHNAELRTQKREVENVSDELTVKNQELIELQQMKEDFTAMIVHDMRSPLMIVQGVLDLLYYKHRTKPDERELIEDGIGVTKKMLQLVSNLLETSKIEAGELHLQREEVELGQFLRESVEPFNVVARAHEIDLETDVAEDLPTIRADRGCLGQVIDNLLSNAFKFSPDGGRIVVSGEVLEPNRDRVRLVVEDTGAGIATADLAKIFKKFRQGRTGGRKGTGLGLTIVELLVNAHHGTVRVESEVGKGSRFIVELPIDGGEGADEDRPNAQNQLRP